MRDTKLIDVLAHDGSAANASVTWWQEGKRSKVSITLAEANTRGEATDFFEAFRGAREPLELEGFRFCCYGASQNVWASGMARDMGLGLKAYVLNIGRKGGVLKDIFESGPEVVPGTVQQQTAFFERWRASLNVRGV